MKPEKQQGIDTFIIVVARFTGYVSLLLFGLFLYFGARPVIDLPFSEAAAIRWNAMLSLLFFLQHSGMVRRNLRSRMATWLPGHYHGAFPQCATNLAAHASWQNPQVLQFHDVGIDGL